MAIQKSIPKTYPCERHVGQKKKAKPPEVVTFKALEFVHATHLANATSILGIQKFKGLGKEMHKPPKPIVDENDTEEEKARKQEIYDLDVEIQKKVSAFTEAQRLLWFTVLPQTNICKPEDYEIPVHYRIPQGGGASCYGEIGFAMPVSSFFDHYKEQYGRSYIYKLPSEVRVFYSCCCIHLGTVMFLFCFKIMLVSFP